MSKRVYLPPKCKYVIDGNRIVTDGSVANRVTGTSMAGIMGISPWSTPFQVACNLLGLAREDISDKPAVKVGSRLEASIVRYAGETYPEYGSFLLAEEVFEKRAGDHDSWTSDFESQTFAGHVDGIVFAEDGNDYILEIKTSGNLDSWKNGVPEYYYWQVALYNHFICQKDKAYVVLGMVNEATYKDYTSWVPNQNTVAMFEMPIDREEVAIRLEEVERWYEEFVLEGVTPEYDPTNPGDVEMYEHLCNLAQDVDEVADLIERYGVVDEQIALAESQNVDLYTERDVLKGKIKDYLTTHGLASLDSTSRDFIGKVGSQTRSKLDEDAMRDDGIDVEKYRIKTVTKTFSIKKNLKNTR